MDGSLDGMNDDELVASSSVVPRKRGETEMSVLKQKLNTLGAKTSLREETLHNVRSDHTVLYDHSISNQVIRGFTRSYLNRATGKLTALLNKPRMRSVDAVNGEQAEHDDGEYQLHAISRIKRHERERNIIQARPMRIGWREKLGHAQVQRGLEERKEAEGRKRLNHEASEATRAAMKRRGRDSDDEQDAEEEAEAVAAVTAAAAAAEAAQVEKMRLLAKSATTEKSALEPDFFLDAPEAKKEYGEHAHRVKDLLDLHTVSSSPQSSGLSTPASKGSFSAGGGNAAASSAVAAFQALSGAKRPSSRFSTPLVHSIGESKEDASGSHQTIMEEGQGTSRGLLRTSASAPSLRTPAQRAAAALHRWKNAHGLHPTDMSSASAATLKIVPKLPVHSGLAAEDVKFTFEKIPPLFVDTHTALEIACAHIHFHHFKSRHKQVHYLLLSPDMNYLLLISFWYIFVKYLQSERFEPKTPEVVAALMNNVGKKYHQFIRYLKIHLALKPSQRLNSWYDQFGEHGTLLPPQPPTPSSSSGQYSARSVDSGVTPTRSYRPPGFSFSNDTKLAFDPFTCVPDYPPELFNDQMEQALIPKTRSGIHHQKERFLLLLPFVLSEAIYELLYAFFPESCHFLTKKFRARIDSELHYIFNGIQMSEVTLVKQRTKFMRESEEKKTIPSFFGSGQNEASNASSTLSPNQQQPQQPPQEDASGHTTEKPTFESMFAFNTQVNPEASKPGVKFHAALMNPNHSSVPGSALLTASAKKLAMNVKEVVSNGGNTALMHTPLTRHTRLGGVVESGSRSMSATRRSAQPPAEGESDLQPTNLFSAIAEDENNDENNEEEDEFQLSPSAAAVAASAGKKPGHNRAQSFGIITSERAFVTSSPAQPGTAGTITPSMLLAQQAAAMSVLLLSPKGAAAAAAVSPGSPAIQALASPLSPKGIPDADIAAQEEKLRRRARERPVKGSLHSTGDWSRDERERRDFLQRMKARHNALEKLNSKEAARMQLRDKRVKEGTGEDEGFDDEDSMSEMTETDAKSVRPDNYDPLSAAFEAVMEKPFNAVPTTVISKNNGLSPLKRTPSKPQLEIPSPAMLPSASPVTPPSVSMEKRMSLAKSFSTPVLAALNSVGAMEPPKLVSPSAASQSGAPFSRHVSRPSILRVPSHASPGLLTTGSNSQPNAKSLGQFIPDTVDVDINVAVGFTASDLSLPLQSMLLMEENMRHAQKLRPPEVKINVNSLTPSSSLSLGLRSATSAWGNGIVLKHTNPIPSSQLGEDLGDGFTYVAPRSHVNMNAINYSGDADARESQLRLLNAYKGLHSLQLQENALRGAHAGSNLEHGDISRARGLKKSTPSKPARMTSTQSTPNLHTVLTGPDSSSPAPLSIQVGSSTHATPSISVAASASVTRAGSAQATPLRGPRTLSFLETPQQTETTPQQPSKQVSLAPTTTTSPSSVAASTAVTPSKKKHAPRSLHKPTKLEILQAEAKSQGAGLNGGHWSHNTPDDPSTFLTPRTLSILAAVEANASQHAEEERKRRELEAEMNN